MIEKYGMLFRTIRYLKIKQIIYQFYYRLKPVKTLSAFDVQDNNLLFHPLRFTISYNSSTLVSEDLSFSFLNLNQQFAKSIDWNYQEHGKLWNYNLQYFNYLQQENISNHVKQEWLIDIGQWLKDGRLKLEPYPVSLRIMNSIRYFSINNIKSEVLLNQTYAQLIFLADNLEFHIMGNHLLENAFALFMGGYAFQKVAWQKKAKNILYRELKEQVLNDGGHFELSPMYHQIILFRVLELADWYSKEETTDTAFLDFIKEKAKRMLGWLQTITFKNGDIPHFNDSANNIALKSQELFAFARQLSLAEPTIIPLRESGYRKFANENYECVLDAGSIAASYQPGHSHADLLSYVLYYHHSPLILNVGISTYEKGDRRNYERSTKAHNTVEIENENQFEVWGGFRVGRRASVTIINETDLSITASHDGYKSLFNAIHERSFYFKPASVKIIDVIHQSKTVNAKSYLHFHPDCKVEQKNGDIVVNNTITISFLNTNQTHLGLYKFASGYNLYQDAKVLVVEFCGSLETLISFI